MPNLKVLPRLEEISGETFFPTAHKTTSTSLELSSAAENSPLISRSERLGLARLGFSTPHAPKNRMLATYSVGTKLCLRGFTVPFILMDHMQSIPKHKTSAFECFFAAPISCVDEFHRTNSNKLIFKYFGAFV